MGKGQGNGGRASRGRERGRGRREAESVSQQTVSLVTCQQGERALSVHAEGGARSVLDVAGRTRATRARLPLNMAEFQVQAMADSATPEDLPQRGRVTEGTEEEEK